MMPVINILYDGWRALHLDSDLLRTFVAVAETGNFTRAGDQVNRTQSAVSMQIRRLEDIVGDTLFQRGSRGVTLTRRGQDLMLNARRIVSLMDETAASMRIAPLHGPVRIGIPEEYGHTILSRALASFSKRHPRVEITVRYAPSMAQIAAVNAGELDLAVVFEWTDFSDDEVLMVDPTVWVTSTIYNRHEEMPIPIAVYANSGWCRDFVFRSLDESGKSYRVAYNSDTNGGLKLAVTSGFAIAPISRSNIPSGCRELGAADGFGPIDSSHVVLRRNPAASSLAIDGMVEAIREAFASPPANA